MKKWHMIVDLEKCVGCFNCMVACKDEHIGNDWSPYTGPQEKHEEPWINPTKYEKGTAPYTEVCFVTRTCQHCDNPQCMEAAPGAAKKRDDGIVLLDMAKAKGNKALVKACPYGAIKWNEELNTAQKCTMCAHLLDNGWKEPRCVQACPLRALSVVYCEDEEFEKMVKSQKLKPITDGSNKPRVMYKNPYKYNKCFIKGPIAYKNGERMDAATEAKVRLLMNGVEIKTVYTDFLGEYKFDRIPKNSGTFTLEYTLDGFEPVTREVTIEEESVVVPLVEFQ